jgi:hypothetical protein
MTPTTTGTLEDLPLAVQKLFRKLREEVKDSRRTYGNAVGEMKLLRREAAKHRVARNEALAEVAQLRAELEAVRNAA